MPRYLSVIENPFRATYEEQDDTSLWFTHAMKNAGAGVGVLLRGNATVYALKDQRAPQLAIGARAMRVLPNIEEDLRALMTNHVTVYAVIDDAAERGVFKDDIILGIQHLPRGWLPKLFDSYERILHW